MKKRVIYTNEDNEDFEVVTHLYKNGKNVRLHIINGNNELYFTTKKEVDEFCEILKLESENAFGK